MTDQHVDKKNVKYCDLNVVLSSDRAVNQQLLDTASRLGYSVLVFNIELGCLVKFLQRKSPLYTGKLPSAYRAELVVPNSLKVFFRLTFDLAAKPDKNKWGFNLANFKKEIKDFDIVAVRPYCEETLNVCLNSLGSEVHIITLDSYHTCGFKLTRELLNKLDVGGMRLELCYGPALRNDQVLRTFVSNANYVASVSKGKLVVMSSAAERPIELRSPFDVINLALVMQFRRDFCKSLVGANCLQVISNCWGQTFTFGRMFAIEKIEVVGAESSGDFKTPNRDDGDILRSQTPTAQSRCEIAGSTPTPQLGDSVAKKPSDDNQELTSKKTPTPLSQRKRSGQFSSPKISYKLLLKKNKIS